LQSRPSKLMKPKTIEIALRRFAQFRIFFLPLQTEISISAGLSQVAKLHIHICRNDRSHCRNLRKEDQIGEFHFE
jgi:hypothetical protein